MAERRWCEACRDHYDGSHYDEHGNHRSGLEFGPVGGQIMAERAYDDPFGGFNGSGGPEFARRARFGWDYWGDQSLGTAEMAA